MTMHQDKCHVMFLSNNINYPKTFSIISRIEINVENSVELFGVIIDNKINFSFYIK